MSGSYTLSFIGFWVLLVLLFCQWLIASAVKGKQPGAVPGKINQDLSHDSFVFRTHRTFQNSLENMPLIIGTFFIAVFTGVNALFTAICVWLYVVGRTGHMILYYSMSTEANPSPRSYFFAFALLANLILLAGVASTFFTST